MSKNIVSDVQAKFVFSITWFSNHLAIDPVCVLSSLFSNRSLLFSDITMSNDRENLQILHQFRPFLQMLTIYHRKHYQSTNRRTLLRNYCQLIGISLLSISTCIFSVSNVRFCIDQQFDLNIIAHPFSFFLGDLQMQLIYIAIVSQSERVEKIVDSLQKVIENRELNLSN